MTGPAGDSDTVTAGDSDTVTAAATAAVHIRTRTTRRTLHPAHFHSRGHFDGPLKPVRRSLLSTDHLPRAAQDAVITTDSRSASSSPSAAPAVVADGVFATSATFSNPLFSNPLFAASTFSIMDLDDAALAKIFGKLLDAEYPNAVWSGSFPPGRADALLAATSSRAGGTPEPLHHFPLDGRPNDGTRTLLAATLVCHRWRRVVRNRVIKYVAAFGPEPDAGDDAPPDSSAAVDDVDASDTWSSSGGSAGALSVASRPQSSGDSLSGAPALTAGTGVAAAGDDGRPRRWALRCRARVVVAAVRRNGVVPFDLRTVDRHSLRSVFLLCPPEHAAPAHITAYDARALATCSSLTSLTLPAPPPPTIGWHLLGSFPFLAHVDFATTATATGTSRASIGSSHSSRSRPSVAPPPPPLPLASLPTLASVSAPWSSLPDIADDAPETLTALRLHGGGVVTFAALAHITRLTGLQSLDLSTPLRWSVDAPGILPPGSASDTVHLAAEACAPLAALHSLRSLCLSGSSRVDGTALATVATLATLTALDLSVCRRVDDAALAHLTTLTNLRSLDLSWCTNIGAPGAAHLGRIRALRALDLTGCVTIDDLGAFSIAALTLLTRLQLRGCPRVGYPGLQTLGDYLAPRLMHIEISSDTDAGAGIFSLFTPRAGNGGRIAPLTHLTLRGFRALPDAAFAPLSGLRAVRSLTIDCCPEAGEAMMGAIAPLTTLTSLTLRFCPGITDASLAHLCGMAHLQTLSLQGAKCLYGGGLRHVGMLHALWSVDLQQCLCLDACGLGFLAPLRRLAVLNVSKCTRIEAGDFAHLTGLRALQHLCILGLEPPAADVVRDMGFHVSAAPNK
eukprot:jgi/Ulvmu1/1101/UM106_0018.1